MGPLTPEGVQVAWETQINLAGMEPMRRRWNSQSDGIAADRTTKGVQRIGLLLEKIGLNKVRGDERNA